MTEMPARIASPEQMRQAVADYVTAVHRAYLEALRSEAAALAATGEFTILAAAAGDLHLIATAQTLPRAEGRMVEMAGELGPLRWRLRFYDRVVAPTLASIATGSDADADVRRALGVDTWLYHLVASADAGLSPHNAFHAGVALATGEAGP
jgi:hypothetical protein